MAFCSAQRSVVLDVVSSFGEEKMLGLSIFTAKWEMVNTSLFLLLVIHFV